jgi:hypothetical protein
MAHGARNAERSHAATASRSLFRVASREPAANQTEADDGSDLVSIIESADQRLVVTLQGGELTTNIKVVDKVAGLLRYQPESALDGSCRRPEIGRVAPLRCP